MKLEQRDLEIMVENTSPSESRSFICRSATARSRCSPAFKTL